MPRPSPSTPGSWPRNKERGLIHISTGRDTPRPRTPTPHYRHLFERGRGRLTTNGIHSTLPLGLSNRPGPPHLYRLFILTNLQGHGNGRRAYTSVISTSRSGTRTHQGREEAQSPVSYHRENPASSTSYWPDPSQHRVSDNERGFCRSWIVEIDAESYSFESPKSSHFDQICTPTAAEYTACFRSLALRHHIAYSAFNHVCWLQRAWIPYARTVSLM